MPAFVLERFMLNDVAVNDNGIIFQRLQQCRRRRRRRRTKIPIYETNPRICSAFSLLKLGGRVILDSGLAGKMFCFEIFL